MRIRTSCVILTLGYNFFVVDNESLPLLAQALPGLTLVERHYNTEIDKWTYTLQNKQLETSLEVISGDQLLDYEESEPETKEEGMEGVILDASSETETDTPSDEAPF